MTDSAIAFVKKPAFDRLRGLRSAEARFAGLYVEGCIEPLAAPTVAVVGMRAASALGRRTAFECAAELGRHGICILSGLALGIDGAAHEGALSVRAPTIGVLGGGHRQFFPKAHRNLARRMIEGGGAVLSPYAPDEPARPPQFLQRNGVVVALCDAVVIVEAGERSGALNTASWAAARGLPVFVFPGDVDRPKVAGCLALIRDGATLVRGAGDVLAGLVGIVPRAPQRRSSASTPDGLRNLPECERSVLRMLADGERSLDELIDGGSRDASEIVAALTMLELAGHVEDRGGGRFAWCRTGPEPHAANAAG